MFKKFKRWLRRVITAEERIEIDGEEYVRYWPTSEKNPRPRGWRRERKRKGRKSADARRL